MATDGRFSYEAAFSRNLGLVNEAEQRRLRCSRVGLAGLGGVGGAHLQALIRLGIGAFHLADMDCFEIANFNRQLGASMLTMGRAKVEVLAEMAREINPEVHLGEFTEGITATNLNAFLDGVDVVVDGIEFFAVEAHRSLHAACRKRSIPVVQAGPVGYGAAVWTFLPQGITFDRYFGLEEEMTWAEQVLAFALGHSPGLVNDVDPRRVDLAAQRGPALASACLLCAATAATEVLKLVCERGPLCAAPRGVYFDPYRAKTIALRPRPSLTQSWRGKFFRYLGFRRFPMLRQLHEQELLDRKRDTNQRVARPVPSA